MGGVGWDREEFLKSNLHLCGRDGTKIVIYNTGRCTKKGGFGKNQENLGRRL